MPNLSIEESIRRSEEALAFFDVVYGSDFTEEKIRDAKVRLMIKKYS